MSKFLVLGSMMNVQKEFNKNSTDQYYLLISYKKFKKEYIEMNYNSIEIFKDDFSEEQLVMLIKSKIKLIGECKLVTFTDHYQDLILKRFTPSFSTNLKCFSPLHLNNKIKMRSLIGSSIFNVKQDVLNDYTIKYWDIWPAIVKPISGEASQNIHMVYKQSDFNVLLENRDLMLIEEFVEGRQFCFEAVSLNGYYKILGITETYVDVDTQIEVVHRADPDYFKIIDKGLLIKVLDA